MTTIITPTDGRPECLRLLARHLTAQHPVGPLQWLIASHEPTIPLDPLPSWISLVLVVSSAKVGWHPLCSNLESALAVLPPGEEVIIMEDDDYYAPQYLQCCLHLLRESTRGTEVVGFGPVRYYKVDTLQYRTLNRHLCPALAQTAFTREGVSRLRKDVREKPESPHVDTRLWRAGGYKQMMEFPIHVGLKGMPGTKGVGCGHRPQPDWDHDPHLRTLLSWGVPLAQYAPYLSTSPCPHPTRPEASRPPAPSRRAGRGTP